VKNEPRLDVYTFPLDSPNADKFADNMRLLGRTVQLVETGITTDAGEVRVLQVRVGKRPNAGKIAAYMKDVKSKTVRQFIQEDENGK
jgi:hypothetical protein